MKIKSALKKYQFNIEDFRRGGKNMYSLIYKVVKIKEVPVRGSNKGNRKRRRKLII